MRKVTDEITTSQRRQHGLAFVTPAYSPETSGRGMPARISDDTQLLLLCAKLQALNADEDRLHALCAAENDSSEVGKIEASINRLAPRQGKLQRQIADISAETHEGMVAKGKLALRWIGGDNEYETDREARFIWSALRDLVDLADHTEHTRS